MHFCQDELVAITAAVPFIGYFCLKCRQICAKCAMAFRRLTGKSCDHHNHDKSE